MKPLKRLSLRLISLGLKQALGNGQQ